MTGCGSSTPARTSSSPSELFRALDARRAVRCSTCRRRRPVELCGDSGPARRPARARLRRRRRTCGRWTQQHIDAAVLFPSMGLFVPYLPELDWTASAAAPCRAYNDWIAEYCATDAGPAAPRSALSRNAPRPGRRRGAPAAELGLVGVLVRPNHVGDHVPRPPLRMTRSTTSSSDRGLVLGVHEALGVRAPTIGRDRFDGLRGPPRLLASARADGRGGASSSAGSASGTRSLRVAFLESGTGWLPYWLARLDDHREWLRDTGVRRR